MAITFKGLYWVGTDLRFQDDPKQQQIFKIFPHPTTRLKLPKHHFQKQEIEEAIIG